MGAAPGPGHANAIPKYFVMFVAVKLDIRTVQTARSPMPASNCNVPLSAILMPNIKHTMFPALAVGSMMFCVGGLLMGGL